MTVPDSALFVAVGGLATFSAWLTKRIANSYFDSVAKTTTTLEILAQEHRRHDQLSAESHRQQIESAKRNTEVLCEIATRLRQMNGKPESRSARKRDKQGGT